MSGKGGGKWEERERERGESRACFSRSESEDRPRIEPGESTGRETGVPSPGIMESYSRE